jgi:hypothetical protein
MPGRRRAPAFPDATGRIALARTISKDLGSLATP